MNLTKKQKLIRAIPGLIVGSIMTVIIIWGISSDKKCNELLKKEDCKAQMVFSSYSKEHMFGNGSRGVSTGFYLELKNEKYKITTDGFAKPIPVGTPIIIRYSPQCPDCNQILWDSSFVYNKIYYRYFYIENDGYDYEITKVTN